MTRQDESGPATGGNVTRRTLVGAMVAGAAFAGSRGAVAQAERGAPPSVVTSPPRDFGPSAPPNVYVFDPDIVIVDPLFTRYVQGNTPIKRLWTGALWSEGPGDTGPGGKRDMHVFDVGSDNSSAGRSAIGCLWQTASRSMRFMSEPKGGTGITGNGRTNLAGSQNFPDIGIFCDVRPFYAFGWQASEQ